MYLLWNWSLCCMTYNVCLYFLKVWRVTKIEPVCRSVGDGSHYFRSISWLFTRENLHKGPLSNSPMSGNITLAVDKVWEEATTAFLWDILSSQIPCFVTKAFWIVWISDKSKGEQPFVFSIKYRMENSDRIIWDENSRHSKLFAQQIYPLHIQLLEIPNSSSHACARPPQKIRIAISRERKELSEINWCQNDRKKFVRKNI